MQVNLEITYLPTDTLVPYARNARTHSNSQVAQIASSIKEFGFTNPVLIDDTGGIIAGHGRVQAAQMLGLEYVPAIVLGHLTDTQRRAYVLADNKLALNSGWDLNMLQLEIEELKVADFNLDVLGFDPSEINFAEVDYSVLEDDEDVDAKVKEMENGIRKAIQIEFEPQDYSEAQELIKWWRDRGAYIGALLMEHLRLEQAKVIQQ